MPLSHKGETIKSALQQEYGKAAGERILYAGKNAGTFTGIDALVDAVGALTDSVAALASRADAIERRFDDHRVIGGVGYRRPR